MVKTCDHTSVGMLVKNGGRLLLIERMKYPFGFAPPAGHLDGDSFEHSAIRELEEEVGIKAIDIKLLTEGRKENKCRREDGNWHYWKIYSVDIADDSINRSLTETKQAGWFNDKELSALALKTEQYLNTKVSEKDWEKSPGIEPVWYEWFKELGVI